MADVLFAHYYQTELAYFRELAQEFAQQYPEAAHLVAERDSDPSTERLFQGASLLMARLRFRVEDDFPEVIQALFDQLWPQYMRSLPAVTLLQMTPRVLGMRESLTVDRGTLIKSAPVQVSPTDKNLEECTFQTCAQVDLHPIQLSAVELNRAHPADLQLKLHFKMIGGSTFDSVAMPSLRLQLLGDEVAKFTLFHWIFHLAHRVSIEDSTGETVLALPTTSIQAAGRAPEESLVPFKPPPWPGFRLLREFFSCPDKFLALEVKGMDKVPPGKLTGDFNLVFHLGQLMGVKWSPDKSNFGLNCTVAVNISEADRLDLEVVRDTHEHRLLLPAGREIFKVKRVGGYDSKTSNWIEYRNLLAGSLVQPEGFKPCYHVALRSDSIEGRVAYLVFTDDKGRPLPPFSEKLRVWLTYTNGDLPSRLGVGDVTLPTSKTPDFMSARNITPVFRQEPVSLDRDRYWNLLARFAMHPSDLITPAGLESMIRMAGGDRNRHQAPRILDARNTLGHRLYRQAVIPLRLIEITLSEETFCCEGHFFFMARLLSELLAPPEGSAVFHKVEVRAGDSSYVFG